jgi:hypothetical protein
MFLSAASLLALVACASSAAAAEPRRAWATVSVGSDGAMTCEVTTAGAPATYHARAVLEPTFNTTGWSSLWVTASDAHSVSLNARNYFAAGCAEGYINAQQIADAKFDLYAGWGFLDAATGAPHPIPTKLRAFLEENLEYTSSLAEGLSDPYAVALGGVVSQLRGMVAGVALAQLTPSPEIDMFAMWMMNAAGSMEDLVGLLSGDAADTADSANAAARARPPLRGGATRGPRFVGKPDAPPLETDCSALIRVTPDDVLFAHTTWRSFTMMTRVLKRYDLPNVFPVSLSSTPAFISSKDDFYLTGAGLMVMETTNNIFDTKLWDLLTPRSLLTFVRSTVANRLARSGPEWVSAFSVNNSGTYNNQWMVLDGNLADRVPAGTERHFLPRTLTIAEQIPGRVASRDVTDVLNARGFWPSYNIPYLPEIYNASGYPAKAQGNPGYSYSECPRAQIFARDAPHVTDVADMQNIMQSCRWKTDPLSLGKPNNCISSRYDLITEGRADAFGGIDSKVASLKHGGMGLGFSAISGPTHAQDDTPPFSWNDPKWSAKAHRGQPLVFDLPWVTFGQEP